MATLHIHDLVCEGIHGVYARERDTPQPFAVTLALIFDANTAFVSDALEDTIDYDRIRNLLTTQVAETSFALIERLAAHLAGELFTIEPHIASLDIRIDKLAAWENGTPGFSAIFERPQ